MTGIDAWNPDHSLGLDRPNVARMYQHLLGGCHTFDLDRRTADELTSGVPEIVDAARANRRFLATVVSGAAGLGIDQFLDLGCGLPASGDLWSLVQSRVPGGRAVLVDSDPVVVSHVAATLADHAARAGVVQADLRDIEQVLGHDETRRVLDLERPVAILMLAVLHFLPGPIAPVVASYRRSVSPGSALAISHISPLDDQRVRLVNEIYQRTLSPLCPRHQAELRALLGDWHPLTGDFAPITAWRRGDTPAPASQPNPFLDHLLACLAVKPGRLRR